MSTTATFEQRAITAGASLRAAFYEGDPMTAPTTFRPPSLEQPRPRSSRRRNLLAVAAAAAVIAAGAAVVTSGGTQQQSLPPAVQPEEKVLTGLRDLPDYPIRLTVPSGMFEVDEDAGSRAFRPLSKQPGGVVITALRSINGTPVDQLPQDVTTLLADRPDVVVTDVRATTVAGLDAQAFTLRVAPGTSPSDLWCPVMEPLCFKLDRRLTAEVLVVDTDAEPLWIATEYTPETQAEVTTAAEQLISSIQLP